MSVTPNQIGRLSAQRSDLGAVVREQLAIIDDKLRSTEAVFGWNTLPHELPLGFTIPGLARREAQRVVYSAIIRSLGERGFQVRLLLTGQPEKAILYIGWVSNMTDEEIEAMNSVIAAARVEPDDVEAFLRGGRA